jgi:hypothetical protein
MLLNSNAAEYAGHIPVPVALVSTMSGIAPPPPRKLQRQMCNQYSDGGVQQPKSGRP